MHAFGVMPLEQADICHGCYWGVMQLLLTFTFGLYRRYDAAGADSSGGRIEELIEEKPDKLAFHFVDDKSRAPKAFICHWQGALIERA